ncbi:Flp family type IVb pilin [Thermorudis peleae]|uniref:Flp family type IVb pilin n=1 Tax=Thermorudis peleae TaxID=1382356 RepID=UPI0012DFF520|nr:hypothetical protein [Thermorudis peleae]
MWENGTTWPFATAGQAVLEYALILLGVALTVVVALSAFGNAVNALYQRVLAQWPGS